MHKFDDGSVKVVCHESRSLTKAEKGYGQVEKEALALIFGVIKFHHFIYGRKAAVRRIRLKKGIHVVHTTNRLKRWAHIFRSYDFEIKRISNDDFGYADVLSLLIDTKIKPEEDFVIAFVHLEEEITAMIDAAINVLPINFKHLQAATIKDKTLQTVIKFIQ
ncbi:uncharacterized protein LOC129752230 [Uranotaenia lowii]|uniref:uncharacterized protein LOC129752230 n=1 Tax=Uranotaenia lowii TaxID=190385 RepID=UPI00247924A7|nr:uncharacterized protein LOC129752230 [Uranotaenia lowii]